MKTKSFLTAFILIIVVSSCSKHISYSPEHIKQTSGSYLFDNSEVIEIYYDQSNLFVKWKGIAKEPVILDENTFFVSDIYKKLRFVQHTDDMKMYLGVVSEDDDTKLIVEYPKVEDNYKTPKMHLNDGDYEAANKGFLELKKQDSTKIYIKEKDVNKIGYDLLQKKKYENAIAVLKMNTELYPNSVNVYDSLGEAYLSSGDSLQAYNNYKKALQLDPNNKGAKRFVEAYNERLK